MSTHIGRAAEQTAAQYLRRHGFEVLTQNWRTRWCEIDVVAVRGSMVYFVEVKYRRSADWGSGLDYVTPRKVQQMYFAAEFWLACHRHNGEARLAAIELSGQPPQVTGWAPIG